MTETPRRNRSIRQRIMQVPEGTAIASFDKYPEAVETVDALIRHEFPAAAVSIIGSNLRSVERVRARMSYGRIAMRGLTTGSWLGLAYWLFFGSTSTTDTTAAAAQAATATLFPSVVIGAGVGMLISVIRFSFQRRSHEFLSMSTIVAGSYDVVVPNELNDKARMALAEHREKCTAKH